MALQPGSRLGAYEITAQIGAGGMGEVYRATDTNLKRQVAIKVLPDAVARDAERMARFQREAEVLASLSHPHIAQIFGFEQADGASALVMELVDGEELSARIARGPIPLDEALPIARQIAEALEAAHDAGIVHRDLKPANIKVRSDGAVKVLDFGLAKASGAGGAGGTGTNQAFNSPTITSPAALTMGGTILGTAAYMAPEQAKGKPVDKRADIWAFGCVLYEMLAGCRAFDGEDVTDTIVSVMSKDPDWSAVPAGTPPSVRRVLSRCLEKDVKRRLPDIGVTRLEFDEASESRQTPRLGDRGQTGDVSLAARTSTAPRRTPLLPWGIALIALLAAFVMWRTRSGSETIKAATRLNVSIGADASLVVGQGASVVPSPDGRSLVFAAQAVNQPPRLFLRRLDQLAATPLLSTEGAANPFFSPDGAWIAFFSEGKLKKVATSGGTAVAICDAPTGRGGAWLTDGSIVFTPSVAVGVTLMRVSSGGGSKPEPFAPGIAGATTERWPQMLPDGKGILYTSHVSNSNFDDAQIAVRPLPSGAAKVVLRSAHYGRYVSSGHLLFVRQGTLFAAPFDLDRLEVLEPAVALVEDIAANGPITGGAQVAVSDTGTLAYLPGAGAERAAVLQWLDESGSLAPLRATAAEWRDPAFSPDGRQLAMALYDGRQWDIWIDDWARDAISRFTTDAAYDILPAWTRDGRRLSFSSQRADGTFNLYWQRADGTGEVQRLTNSANRQMNGAWHPDGRILAFSEADARTNFDLMLLPVDGDETTGWKPGTPTVFLNGPFEESQPAFSPDGRWIAYLSTESGSPQVYVRPFPGPGAKYQVSTGFGVLPIWSQTRPELFFVSQANQIMVAPYRTEGGTFQADKPHVWTPQRYLPRTGQSIALHPDGRRFAMASPPVTDGPARVDKFVLVLNLLEELQRIAPRH